MPGGVAPICNSVYGRQQVPFITGTKLQTTDNGIAYINAILQRPYYKCCCNLVTRSDGGSFDYKGTAGALDHVLLHTIL